MRTHREVDAPKFVDLLHRKKESTLAPLQMFLSTYPQRNRHFYEDSARVSLALNLARASTFVLVAQLHAAVQLVVELAAQESW